MNINKTLRDKEVDEWQQVCLACVVFDSNPVTQKQTNKMNKFVV